MTKKPDHENVLDPSPEWRVQLVKEVAPLADLVTLRHCPNRFLALVRLREARVQVDRAIRAVVGDAERPRIEGAAR